MLGNNNIDGVMINTESVHIGDEVAENRTPWIKAMVIGIEDMGEGHTAVTVVWLRDERHHNMIARKGRMRRYSVNKYGVSDIRKV